MKTEKQIYLKSLEKGAKYYEHSETIDIIEIEEKQQYQWFKDIKQDEDILYVPIIPNGTFIAKYPDYEGRIIFDAELNENDILFHTVTLYIKDNEYHWLCTCDYTVPFENKQSFDFNIKNYSDATTDIYTKQKMPEEMIYRHIDKNIEKNSAPFTLFLRAMAWINYLMSHPEYKEIDKTDVVNNKGKLKKKTYSAKKTVPTTKPKTVTINNIKFKVNNSKTASKIRSKQIQRIASCWGVRGHFRHYKSGKVVYIKPYQKGENRNERIRKRYKV